MTYFRTYGCIGFFPFFESWITSRSTAGDFPDILYITTRFSYHFHVPSILTLSPPIFKSLSLSFSFSCLTYLIFSCFFLPSHVKSFSTVALLVYSYFSLSLFFISSSSKVATITSSPPLILHFLTLISTSIFSFIKFFTYFLSIPPVIFIPFITMQGRSEGGQEGAAAPPLELWKK